MMQEDRKHSHYFRPFPYDSIDIYRFLEVFDVTCPVAQHIIKKAVASGQRGHKDLQRDWQDIVDSAQRKLEMLRESDDLVQTFPDDMMDALGKGWFNASQKELGKCAVEHALTSPGCPVFEDDTDFSLQVKEETPWYPSDIPGLEWKEASGGVPYKMWNYDEVYYLTRLNRKNRDWSRSWTRAVNLNWRHDDNDLDIVAYAVKSVENKTLYVQPKEVVPVVNTPSVFPLNQLIGPGRTLPTHGIDKTIFQPTGIFKYDPVDFSAADTLDCMSNGAGKIGGRI